MTVTLTVTVTMAMITLQFGTYAPEIARMVATLGTKPSETATAATKFREIRMDFIINNPAPV